MTGNHRIGAIESGKIIDRNGQFEVIHYQGWL